MDGVLFDSEPLHVIFEQNLFRSLNINLSDEQKKQLVGLGDHKVWKLIMESFPLEYSLGQLLEKDRRERLGFFKENDVPVMPGARELLMGLSDRGFSLALASSSRAELIDLFLSRAGFSDFFGIRVSNEMVKNGKPDPDIFLYAADRMKVPPRNCLVVEDSENGVNAAKSAGMKCIAFRSRTDFHQDVSGADFIVSRLDKITNKLILELGNQ
jgi:HAD superfamily hydrolase (TIGR01509 family)